MERYCKFCGTKIQDGAAACASCGAPAPVAPAQPAYQQPAQPAYGAPAYPQQQTMMPPPKKKKTGLIIGIVVGVLALIVVGFVVILALAGMTEEYQEPVEAWMEAIEEDDVDMMYDAYYEDMWDGLGYTESQVRLSLQMTIDSLREGIEEEAGDNYDVYPVYGDIDEYDDDRIEDLSERLGIDEDDDIEIESAYEIEATITASGDDDTVESDELTFVVVLIDGEWDIVEVRGLS